MVNVKNGIVAVVGKATTLVKNVDQNQRLNPMKKIKIFKGVKDSIIEHISIMKITKGLVKDFGKPKALCVVVFGQFQHKVVPAFHIKLHRAIVPHIGQ